jgi:hypothetical protein
LAYLSLSDDELALLRFTCDLRFVEESPLYVIETEQREPQDYEGAYHSLVEKGVVDPHGFRITDDALNRLAPLTECDARVVHLTQPKDGPIEQLDYYLLDEIAVQYLAGDGRHAIGADMDPDELVAHLARRLVPRKSRGDRIDVQLEPLEYMAFAALVRATRGPEPVPLERVRDVLGRAPTSAAVSESGPQLLAVMPPRGARAERTPVDDEETLLLGDTTWDTALGALQRKGVLRGSAAGLALRPALVELARGLERHERHTFVRYDFGDGEWLMRETTLVPTDGGLYFVGTHPGGGMRLRELDGGQLRAGLASAVGPLPRDQSAPRPRRLRDLLLGSGPSLEGAPA